MTNFALELEAAEWLGVRDVSSNGLVAWNPGDKAANIALSGSNLIATKTTNDALASVRANFGRSSTDNGYFEVRVLLDVGSPYRFVGLSNWAVGSADLNGSCGDDAGGWGYYEETGAKYHNNVYTAFGSTYTTDDQIGVAFKNGKVWFSKNGVWQGGGDPAAGTGEAFSGLTGTLYPTATLYRVSGTAHVVHFKGSVINCLYPAPSGFGYWER